MCEWRIFLPMLHPSDSRWIRNTAVLEQYRSSLSKLEYEMNSFFAAQGNDHVEERTDRYYMGTDNIGLKNRAGKKLEVKVRDSVSPVVMGGEYWNKYKIKKDPAGAARYQADIDNSTAKHQLIDVIKSRRRDPDKEAPICYEKTIVNINFPFTTPENNLTSAYYSGRSWVTICLEGDESTVLHELQNATPQSQSPLALLQDSLALCLQLRYSSVAHSCHESFFPVLSGYPSFVRFLTQPSASLLPIHVNPLLLLLDALPMDEENVSDAYTQPLLPEFLYAPFVNDNPILSKYIYSSMSASTAFTWRSCPSSSNLDPDGSAKRIVPYVPNDISQPEDIVGPIRDRRNGSLLNLDRILLHSPNFALGWNSLFGQLRGSNISVDPKYKELAICVVAVLNNAEYEFYQHLPPWTAAGGSEEQSLTVRLLGDGNHERFLQAREQKIPLLSWTCFSDIELDIIQLTIEMTKNVKTTPSLMKSIQSSLGGNAQLVEITGVIAGYNMVSRFLVALDITADGEINSDKA